MKLEYRGEGGFAGGFDDIYSNISTYEFVDVEDV